MLYYVMYHVRVLHDESAIKSIWRGSSGIHACWLDPFVHPIEDLILYSSSPPSTFGAVTSALQIQDPLHAENQAGCQPVSHTFKYQ